VVRRSGLPVPLRRTFVSALPASTHCMSAALRHRGFACSHSPAPGHGQPRAPSFHVQPLGTPTGLLPGV